MSKTNIPWILTALLTVALWVQTCHYKNQKDQITELQLKNQKLDSTLNKKGQVIYEQDAIVTTQQSTIASLTDSVFNLKSKDKKNREVIAYYQGRTRIGFHDTLEISWLDTVAMKRFSDSLEAVCTDVIKFYRDSSLQIPHTDSLVNKNVDFNFTLLKTGGLPSLRVNKLLFPDTLNLQFVEHKGGLFRRKSVEIQFFHSNPYVNVLGSNSVIYKPKPKPKLLQKAILIGAGIFLGTKL